MERKIRSLRGRIKFACPWEHCSKYLNKRNSILLTNFSCCLTFLLSRSLTRSPRLDTFLKNTPSGVLCAPSSIRMDISMFLLMFFI
jgi:hypothetical protein